MKNRLEYKYLVPLREIDRLRKNLLVYLQNDDYAIRRPEKEYTVRSVYLDSWDYRCYYEKIDGIHTRKKFRIRGYDTKDENSRVYFEIKRKYDNFISKDRAGVPYCNLNQALRTMNPGMFKDENERSSFNNFYHHYHLRRLEPKVLVVYDREPFECKFGSKLRITFDKNLRSRVVSGYDDMYSEHGLVTCFRNEFILEVKFFQVLPQWISRVLENFDLTRMAVSKYTSSIDSNRVSSIILNKLNRNDFIPRCPNVTEPTRGRSVYSDVVANCS